MTSCGPECPFCAAGFANISQYRQLFITGIKVITDQQIQILLKLIRDQICYRSNQIDHRSTTQAGQLHLRTPWSRSAALSGHLPSNSIDKWAPP